MTNTAELCKITPTRRRYYVKGGFEMPLILALIGIALDVPKEIVGGLLVIFLIRELA